MWWTEFTRESVYKFYLHSILTISTPNSSASIQKRHIILKLSANYARRAWLCVREAAALVALEVSRAAVLACVSSLYREEKKTMDAGE